MEKSKENMDYLQYNGDKEIRAIIKDGMVITQNLTLK
jgi:hypothetical protein